MKKIGLGALAVVVILFGVYQYDPYLFRRLTSFEGFESKKADAQDDTAKKAADDTAKKAAADKMAADKKAADAKMAMDKKDMSKKPNVAAFQNPPKEKFTEKNATATSTKEAFADLSAYEGKADFGSAEAPAGCYPRDQLTPSELLPKDMNSIWAEQNPMGPGSLKGKNFLSAGALIGVNTVGQSLRNANLQVRSEPPNPQVSVSIFNQSTISPDISHRPLEIGS